MDSSFFYTYYQFFSVYEQHNPERIFQIEPLKDSIAELGKKLNELKTLGFMKVIVRSSATIETLRDRGNLKVLIVITMLMLLFIQLKKFF
jgi:hypothetical protein